MVVHEDSTSTLQPPSSADAALFGDRLIEAIEAKRSPVMVGLDPHLDLFPAPLRHLSSSPRREVAAAAAQRFFDELLEAVADVVAIVKPQVAFFERLGPPGWEALERVVGRARELGLLVLVDAKRGDIGSTAQAYADYYLGPAAEHGGLEADAMTVSPYLGTDSLEPFASYFERGKGLFVLAKTSNPGSAELQELQVGAESPRQPLHTAVGKMVSRLGETSIGEHGFAAAGLVVGATSPRQAGALRRAFPQLPFLVPGYGAQGAAATDVAAAFDADNRGVVVNASRSILFAYRAPRYQELGDEGWAEASRRECCRMRDEIGDALGIVRASQTTE